MYIEKDRSMFKIKLNVYSYAHLQDYIQPPFMIFGTTLVNRNVAASITTPLSYIRKG